MDMKYQLLAHVLSDVVYKKVETAFDEMEEWVDVTSMVMLVEIREIINDKSLLDSDIVEKIIEVYEKNNITC